jgi:two-component system, chemotaxis family, CheB/CheR fusion protein
MRNPRTRRPGKRAPTKAGRRSSRKTAKQAPTTPSAPVFASRQPVSFLETEATGALPFPVVGLGASAGGLEAIEAFFRHVPTDIGMAFVVVSHLDPSHESILTEIVQRTTALPVVEATDQLAVKPNRIYVIPPNRDLAIFHGTLQLSVPEAPRGQRMPIDAFFRSLAEDQGEQAMGVVLSGTGSDGTLGLRAILGSGGVTYAQDPATAKYDGMPSSAVRAGYVAHVLPVERMPDAMRTAARASGLRPGSHTAPATLRGLRQILSTLRSRTGHDFSLYKKSTVVRRIERRMALHDLQNAETYARYLKEHPEEVQSLFKELLINVTSFFRDPVAFEALRNEVLPRLFAGKPDGWIFRAWIAGCASGEEAYSIAMLVRELLDETHAEHKVQIYATDLDDDAIAVARAGVYPGSIVQDVSPERLRRFFLKDDDGYRVKKEIREMVVFAVQNVIKDPPFTRLDLLSCRNLMIYLEPELQERLVATFHYALRQGGVLFLSPSESLGHPTDLFRPIHRRWKLFEVVPSSPSARLVPPGAQRWTETGITAPEGAAPRKSRESNVAELTARALLQSFAPASVVTDEAGNILYVHGETGKYLRPAPGRATLNVIDMARGNLEAELRAAYRRKGARGATPLSREVTVRIDGSLQPVLLGVRSLGLQKEDEALVLVTFQERPRTELPRPRVKGHGKAHGQPPEGRKMKDLEQALADSKDLLRTTVEEQQASTEELKSMNEELQSTNEELQSTNEELETSKEELQSVNEELVTVNAELQSKIEQLAGMQNDMRNLLDNVNVGTIFLDEQLTIRRFTREATKVFRLVSTDVGRPILDIKADLDTNALLEGAQHVLETLVPWEHEARTPEGGCYLVRIQPYRTLDNVIDGVVLTLTDITARSQAETAVEEARTLAESIVDTVREPLLVLDGAMQVRSASRAFYQYFQTTPDETVGREVFQLGSNQWNIPALRDLLEAVLRDDRAFDDYLVEHDFPRIGRRRLLLNARRIALAGGEARLVLLAMEEVARP